MITTRTEATNFLKSQEGFNEAMAKVVVNECFNLNPVAENDNDLLRFPEGGVVQIEESELRPLYEQMVLSEIDVDGQTISVLGEPKYNLFGDLLPVPQPMAEPTAEEQPETEDGENNE